MSIVIKKKPVKKQATKKAPAKKKALKKKVLGTEPKAHVSVEVKNGNGGSMKSEKQEVLGNVIEAEGPTANVGFKAGVTRNMGDFNSVRIDVSLYMPCDPDEASINDTFEFVKGWADKKMAELSAELGAD